MRTQEVHFYSEGHRVAALWRTPDREHGRCRGIVQGPRLARTEGRPALPALSRGTDRSRALACSSSTTEGSAARRESGPSPPHRQLQDLRNAVTYLETRDDVDADAIGTFGSGGTGGGNAVLLAAADSRVTRRREPAPGGRRGGLAAPHADRARLGRVPPGPRGGSPDAGSSPARAASVNPREEIMVPTPERRATRVKADVDTPGARPDPARRGRRDPGLSADRRRSHADASPCWSSRSRTTPPPPTDHAVALYEAARGPRELILQRHTSHYASYEANGAAIAARIVEWFDRHLVGGHLVVRSRPGAAETGRREVRAPASPLRRGGRPGPAPPGRAARRGAGLRLAVGPGPPGLRAARRDGAPRPDLLRGAHHPDRGRRGDDPDRARHRGADPVPTSARARADGGDHDAPGRPAPRPRSRRRRVRPRVRGGGARRRSTASASCALTSRACGGS